MALLLTAYALTASAFLIWLTAGRDSPFVERLRSTLEYEPISPALLNMWTICCSNLIVIDLRLSGGVEIAQGIPDALRMARGDLTCVLLWLPPGSKLVVYEDRNLEPFDSRTESILSSFGIRTVYFLEGGLAAWQRIYPLHSTNCISAAPVPGDVGQRN